MDLERLKDLLTSQPALNAAHEIADQYPSGRSIHMAELITAAIEAVEDELRNEIPDGTSRSPRTDPHTVGGRKNPHSGGTKES